MHQDIDKISYCYKLSATNIKKMCQKRIITSDRRDLEGCSSLQILTMIHLSHICSKSGYVENVSIFELSFVLHCTRASVYNVLRALEERELIKMDTANDWSGYKSIQILNNDFSDNKKIPRYLNTNHDFFNYRDNKGYEKVCSLSLYALRTLLLLLLDYNAANGINISFDTLCSRVCVKRRTLIFKYINELRDILGEDNSVRITKAARGRIRYGNLVISKNKYSMIPNKEVSLYADTYYKSKWKDRLRILDIYPEHSLNNAAGRICAIVINFLNKNLSLEFIENRIIQILTSHGIANENVYSEIYGDLLPHIVS